MGLGMTGVRAVLALGLAAAGMSAPARADTVYDFTPTSTTNVYGQAVGPFSLVLTLADGFTPESFARTCSFGSCGVNTGNFADFSLAAYDNGLLMATLDNTPDLGGEGTHGTINGNNGSLFWSTNHSITVTLAFGNGVWNAMFDSDLLGNGPCPSAQGCKASGTLAAVPEPVGLGMFGVGLLGVVAARRRRSAVG